MTVPQPRWFGPEHRSLFGWTHLPSGSAARGAVVVCPSMGQEAAYAHYTLRHLADRLADLGFVVVRFDYDGLGDSVGHFTDPGRVAAWTGSIDEAVALARTYTSAPLSLLGMRLGALLATAAAQVRDDVHGLVLWDSPRSGSSYVREQRIRQNTSIGGADPGSDTFTALGLNLTAETREHLAQLDLRSLTTVPAQVVVTADRPQTRPLSAAARTRTGEPCTRILADDQDDFLLYQTLPTKTEDALVDWFDQTYPHTSFPMDPEGGPAARTILRVAGGTERLVRIGDADLFGVLTEPDQPHTTTAAVFVPDAFTPHVGQSRIWTDTAREWCQSGVRSLRFDLSGCGDSQPRPGLLGHRYKILEHLDEVDDAVRFVRPADPSDTVLIGLCSGAYHALESALALHPRGVALINPVLAFPSEELPVSPRRRAIQRTRPTISRLFGRLAGKVAWRLSPQYRRDPTFVWERMLESCFWQRSVNHQLSWVPEWCWTVANRLLVVQRPEQLMRRVLEGGTAVLWVSGEADWRLSTLGSQRALARVARRHDLTLVPMSDLDHAMMVPGARDRVVESVTGFTHAHLTSPRLQHPPEEVVGQRSQL